MAYLDGSNEGGIPADPTPARVISLTGRTTLAPAMVASLMRDYWDSLRQGRAVPLRSDVDSRGMRGILEYAFVLERIAPGAARFRLAGQHLVDLMGMEVRGMPLCAFFVPGSRGHLSDVLETVFRAPQIAQLNLAAPASYAQPALTGTMLLLPLRSDLGDVNRALGCLATQGMTAPDAGRGPRRFELQGETLSPLVDGGKVVAPTASLPGLSEPPAPWRARRSTAERADGDRRGPQQCTTAATERACAEPPQPVRGFRPRLVVDNT